MAKRLAPSLADDFRKVMEFFSERHMIPFSPASALIENIRKIHSATYSLILWRFRLKGLPAHGKPFIEEIASDALQILPQVLMGSGKPVNLLIRGIIENTLRHIYFSDHPVEFARMNQEKQWFMTMADLFTYTKTHPALASSEKRFDAINQLSTLYSDLSGGIHGRAVADLEMRIALNKISYSESLAKRHVVLVERCAAAANFLIAVFHKLKLAKFQTEDRLIIFQTMPPRARKAWRDSL